MKICQKCGQHLAEEVVLCPSCGSEVREGRHYIDDYRILDVVHEGYSSILCRAVKTGSNQNVAIRIFTPQSAVDEAVAARLRKELAELQKLPQDYFVRHFDIRKSDDGLWYRVSEWIEAEQSWSSLLSSGFFQDYHFIFRFFGRLASILEGLHRIGHIVPHLILNDLIVFKSPANDGERLDVKIDYKVSRFLDPKLDRPGPMLKRLLFCHPDISHQRPLDYRSDIWSLGKIYVELLSGDLEVTDFRAAIDRLTLPAEIGILLKTMLAEDPDMRPQSMAAVADAFARVKSRDITAAMRRRHKPVSETNRILKWWVVLPVLVLIIVSSLWVFHSARTRPPSPTLSDYANRYAPSVAFVMVEYWIKGPTQYYYRNRSEGTAFLADQAGYLLTNRHVACPWLEDANMFGVIRELKKLNQAARFDYRAYLWFEGQQAFKRLPALSENPASDELYNLDTAYRTDGQRRLTIAGVAPPPSKTWQQIKSPLRDDFAVLRIVPAPAHLQPLPLNRRLAPLKVPKLLPIIALGFPLGSQTQGETINVSVTRGHVRRAFENFLQVDSSIYRGNSGGPIIDAGGEVIGIASSVAVELVPGPFPLATPLSDLGMVLPITPAASFLSEIKNGRVKWNGMIDLALELKVNRLLALARKRRWNQARTAVDEELKTSLHPAMVTAGAMLHACAGDDGASRRLFEQSLSIDPENDRARWLIYLLDWRRGQAADSPYRAVLKALDWRSPNEIYSHLVDVLEGRVNLADALNGGYTAREKSWLHYAAGLLGAHSEGASPSSEKAFRQAVLLSDDTHWIHYLALAALDQVEKRRLAKLADTAEKADYRRQTAAFDRMIEKIRMMHQKKRERLLPLMNRLNRDTLDHDEKEAILLEMRALDPANSGILLGLIFENLGDGDWSGALKFIQQYRKLPGRENIGKLRCGLLEAEMNRLAGRTVLANRQLAGWAERIETPWYRSIVSHLLGKISEETLWAEATGRPEHLLTGHTALGLWAEGSGDIGKAVAHYMEALGTYRDELEEYGLAVRRIKALRLKARQN